MLLPLWADAEPIGMAGVLDSLISGEIVSSTVGAEATLQLSADGTLSGSTGCRAFSDQFTAGFVPRVHGPLPSCALIARNGQDRAGSSPQLGR